MPICKNCGSDIPRKSTEAIGRHSQRKFCGTVCSKYFARFGVERKPARRSSEGELQNRIRNLVNGPVFGRAVLNPELVRKIRELHNPLGFSPAEISKHMDVSVNAVQKVVKNETWKNVD